MGVIDTVGRDATASFPSSSFLVSLVAALALAAAGPAAAGDCWVATAESPDTGLGEPTTAPRYAPLREKLDRIERTLRAEASVAALDRVRYQVHRFIGAPVAPGAPLSAQVDVYLHEPSSWQGTCGLIPEADDLAPGALEVTLNDLSPLATVAESAIDEDGLTAFFALEQTGRREGYPVYGGRVVVIAPQGVAVTVPVTVGEYLDFWGRKIDDERAGLIADDPDADPEWRAFVAQMEESDPHQAKEIRRTVAESKRRLTESAAQLGGEKSRLVAYRASLPAARLASPVAITSVSMENERFGVADAADPEGRGLVRFNPALPGSAKEGESRVRLVVLSVYLNDEETPLGEKALGWIVGGSLAPYRGLLDE
jgi:hypothetical protein